MAQQNNHQEEREEFLYKLRHSTAHVMAGVVLEMFPEGKIAIGPPIENGFYYDFDLPRPLTPEDLQKIEERMREVIAADYPFERRVISPEEARELFRDQPYKLELIEDILNSGTDEYGEGAGGSPELTTYRHDAFEDLCRGPHLESTGQIPVDGFKLLNVAGAYWRGDERRPMLQRIYGTAWPSKEELDRYLAWLEEVERRDHRRLGRELDLFSISPELGGGLILWHPKGGMVRKIAEDFCRAEHEKAGYDFVYSPHIGRAALWQTSGHLDFFRENMYAPIEIEGQEYYLKPMNCPFHILIYKSRLRSYRDLPLRFAEWGTVYRYERGGVLHGLLRVRGFTQDDAHIFCRPDQMPEEIDKVLNFCLHILRSFGFTEFNAYLSTRPEKAVGDEAQWRDAEAALQTALERAGISFKIDEGGGAFYGPKIDLKINDALGREWQLSTIQFDFNLPERFDLTYIGEDGKEHRPYMIHRALLGSMERFFGVLIEHYAGAFPVWLAPVQVQLIPIADRHVEYAEQVAERLRDAGLRVEVNRSAERMQAKIRDAQLQKIPYMLIVGDRESENGTVAVRLRTGEDKGAMPVERFLEMTRQAIERKALL
ncbi:MAG TPA: threonine--tRNA ligase [Caldilineae bacterium]|nr:threonine--tRNA ligase [Caldilineae bacterium]